MLYCKSENKIKFYALVALIRVHKLFNRVCKRLMYARNMNIICKKGLILFALCFRDKVSVIINDNEPKKSFQSPRVVQYDIFKLNSKQK